MRRLTEAVRKSTRGRRSMTALWKRPWVIRGGAIIGFAMLVGAVGWIGADGRLNDAYENARVGLVDISAAAGLVTSEVFVVGREKTPRRVLIDALDVTLGAPLLSFDAEAARRRIEAIGWVREAVVERRFPDTIFLRIEERDPLALWQKNGRLFVIDNDGVVIKGASPQNYALLPVIVGDDAPANAGLLLTVLASEPSLHQRVAAAVRVGGRRWNLRFDNGVDVELPEQNFAAAWRRLAEFERIHQLLARDITAIDLRLPDRLVVRPAEAFSGWSAEGENT
ncbi:MAG: cell division protein FtsQ/DivIB [Alphaproteobacteria bacterium]